MKATLGVVRNNSYLAEEFYKNGRLLNNTQHTRDERAKQGFRMKKKSDETVAREGAERRYQNRKNVCEVCFELKGVGNGTCSCT